MKTFEACAAQGDVLFRRISEIPAEAKQIGETGDQPLIVTHSETGHHHTITAPPGIVQLFGSSDPLIGYLRVKAPVTLDHQRAWDTHEPLAFDPGCFEIRRQREWVPEGWRRVED